MLGGRSGNSARDSRCQQAWDYLTHLMSAASLTNSSPLFKAVAGRINTISCLCTAKRSELETLHLPDGSEMSPDIIGELLLHGHY